MRYNGQLPPIGARIRHYHPWLDDHAIGTVVRLELRRPWDRFFRDGAWHNSYRIHLTDCEHWNERHEWGPAPDTYFDNIAEPWEFVEDAEAGLETVLPAADATTGPGEGAGLDL